MSLSQRTQQPCRRCPAVGSPAQPTGWPTDRETGATPAGPLLCEYDAAGRIEELEATVQATFEGALSAAAGDVPSADALRACEALLCRLGQGLDEAFANDRLDAAIFWMGQYRLRFAKILEQLCGLELSEDDQLATVAVVHVFATYANAVASKWPGVVLPLPLHEVGAVAPLMDRLSPFCEGPLLFRAPGGANRWQRHWAVLDRGQLALYSSRVKADSDPGTCSFRMSLGAVACVQTDGASRMLTLPLLAVAKIAHAAGHGGLTVTEHVFGSMEFRVDMAPDYKAWSCALSAAQKAASLWSKFSSAQPQWSQLAKSSSPRWTTSLSCTAEPDIMARMASAASERIGICLLSDQWWSILDSAAADSGSLTAMLDGALQGMLCLLSNALWTRLAATAAWYWDCQSETKSGPPVDEEEQCNHMIATDVLVLAHCELLRQLSAAISEVLASEKYQQRSDEQARLGTWSMNLQCQAGRWCGGLAETLQPLRQAPCWPAVEGPGVLIHRNQLPSPNLIAHNGLDDPSSWCGVDQWCVVEYASSRSTSISGHTETDRAGAVLLQCISCLPSTLEYCSGGDRSGRMGEVCLPDGRYVMIFEGESGDVPAVLWLDNAELAEKWKCAIRDMQTSTAVVFGDEGAQKDIVEDLMEATHMVEELCIALFEMYAAAVTPMKEQKNEIDDQHYSGGSAEPQARSELDSPSGQASPPPIAADCDSPVASRTCTSERAADVQRAIQCMFKEICVSHLSDFGASTSGVIKLDDDTADQEEIARALVRWSEWYNRQMDYVASSLAVAMNLEWGATLRAAGPRLQASPAFSAAIEASCCPTITRLHALVDAALTRARAASDSSVFTVDGRCVHVFWQDFVVAAWREFEALSTIGCIRLVYNLARGIVRLFEETAAACAASDVRSSSGGDKFAGDVSADHIDWVCTAVNSAVLAWPLVAQLLARFEDAIPEPYRTQLDTNCVKVAFSNMARDGVEWLASAVVKDVQTILSTSPSRWLAQVEDAGMDMAMAAIVATIADYFDDLAVLLVRQQLETVAEGVAIGFVHEYLESLLRNPHGRRMADDAPDAVAAQTAKAVEDDLLLVLSVLSAHLPTPRLDTALQPLRSVANLLVAPIVPVEKFALEFDRLCRRHWGSNGISFALAERILDLRGVTDGVLSRAKSNARTACEQRLAAHWSAVQLVVGPGRQSTHRTQETSRRRRVNWQRRGCDSFCHSCAGPASATSDTHQLEQCRTPSAFELLEGELGIAELSTFAELELFREEMALARTLEALEASQVEFRALEQKKEECDAVRDMYRAELSDLNAELSALAAPSAMPAQEGMAKLCHAIDAPDAEASGIVGDDI